MNSAKRILVSFGLLSLLTFVISQSCFAGELPQVLLSLKSAELQLDQAETAYKNKNLKESYSLASNLRPLLSEITELHSQLYEALKDDSNATSTAQKEKELTIQFAKLRDRANYLSGLISKAQGNYLEAVKHLTLVVQSQRSTGLGKNAYEALREMGFSPYLSIQDQV